MALGGGLVAVARVIFNVDTAELTPGLVEAERQVHGSSTAMGRDMNTLTGHVGNSSSAFHGLGRAVAFASTAFLGGAGLTVVMSKAVGQAENLQKAIAATTIAFGQNARQVIAWSRDSATAMGLARSEALTMASSVGILLKNMGEAPRTVAQMSTALVKLAADIAATRPGTDPNDVLTALAKGIAGASRGLKTYGIVFDQTAVKEQAFRMGLITTNPELTKHAIILTSAQKAAATYQLILQQTTGMQGQFAKRSGDAANQMKILHSLITNVEEELGQALLPEIAKLVTQLNAWIIHAEKTGEIHRDLEKTVHTLTEALDVLEGAVKLGAHGFEDLSHAVGGDKHAIELLVGAFVALKLTIGALKLASLAQGLGLIGTRAAGAEGEVLALRGSLLRLGALPPIIVAVGISYFVAKNGLSNTIQAGLNPFHSIGSDLSGEVPVPGSGNPNAQGSPAYYEWERAHNGLAGATSTGSSADANASPQRGSPSSAVSRMKTQGGSGAYTGSGGVPVTTGTKGGGGGGGGGGGSKKSPLLAIPGALQQAYSRATGTAGIADDIKALTAEIDWVAAQLKKGGLSGANKTSLTKAEGELQKKLQSLYETAAATKAKQLADVPGMASTLKAFQNLQGGNAYQSVTVAGIGKFLMPLNPTIADWKKMLAALTLKLKAARKRQAALKRSLARAQKVKHKDPKIITTIAKALATINGQVVELEQDIGQTYGAILDLGQTAADAAQQAADEAEQNAGTAAPPDTSSTDFTTDAGTDTTTTPAAAAAGTDPTAGDGGLLTYLQSIQSLRQTQADNIIGANIAGSTITVVNNFQSGPTDPHLFTQGLQFELQTMLG